MKNQFRTIMTDRGLEVDYGVYLACFIAKTEGRGDFIYQKEYPSRFLGSPPESVVPSISRRYSPGSRMLSIPPLLQLSECRCAEPRSDDHQKEIILAQVVCKVDGSPSIPADFGDLSNGKKDFFLSKCGVTVTVGHLDPDDHSEIVRIAKHVLYSQNEYTFETKSTVLWEGFSGDGFPWETGSPMDCYRDAINAARCRYQCIECDHVSHFTRFN